MPKKTANKQTKVFILIASLIVLVLSALFVKNSMTDVDTSNSGTEPTQVVQPVVAPPEVPEGWVQYVNEEYGYSFWYPSEVRVNKNFEYTTGVDERKSNDQRVLQVSSFYVKGVDSLFSINVIENDADSVKLSEATELLQKIVANGETIDLGGYEAFHWVYESQSIGSSKIILKNHYLTIENAGRVYLINVGSLEEDHYFSYENFTKEIISTFRLM